MVTITWSAKIIFLLGYYWPVTVTLAIALVVVVWYHTKMLTCRVLGIVLAGILITPVAWLYWISLVIQS